MDSSQRSRESPSDIIAQFGIEGDPVPWKAPSFGKRRTYKDPRLKAWQKQIALEADKVKPEIPYEKPVEVNLWFVKFHKDKRKWGKWWDKRPDIDNLRKAVSDAIDGQALRGSRKDQPSPVGRIILDDNQITKINDHKVYGPKSGIWVEIRKIDNGVVEMPQFFRS